MIVDCAHYQDGRRVDEGPVGLEEAAARCKQGGFVWLGLFEPDEASWTRSATPSACKTSPSRTR